MHNLLSNLSKIHNLAIETFKNDLHDAQNFFFYPRKPKTSDMMIIALSITAEAMSIDSENLLYGKIKKDYPALFAILPHRCNYNRRKRNLRDQIDEFASRLIDRMNLSNLACLIDSMPLPVCRIARAGRLKILTDDSEMLPKTGYSAIDKNYFHGYKLHCLSSAEGPIVNFMLSHANTHDIKMLSDMTTGYIYKCTLIGDKGYISQQGQLDLFEKEEISLITPPRKNSKNAESQWGWHYRKKRKRIETTFSQFCDQFLIKRNYAKKFSGLFTRITAKIAAFTTLQYINWLNDRPLNQVKYALSF